MEIERAVIGAMIRNPNQVGEILKTLKPDHFSVPSNRVLMEHIVGLHAEKTELTYASLGCSLWNAGDTERAGGILIVHDIDREFDPETNIEAYVRILANGVANDS